MRARALEGAGLKCSFHVVIPKIETTTDNSLSVLKENPLEKGRVGYFEPDTDVNRFTRQAID